VKKNESKFGDLKNVMPLTEVQIFHTPNVSSSTQRKTHLGGWGSKCRLTVEDEKAKSKIRLDGKRFISFVRLMGK
jgi:hypothetical protein